MNKITKDDILKLAKLSQIDIDINEIDDLYTKINSVLEYASLVEDIAKNKEFIYSSQFINITRKDTIESFNSDNILNEAPEKDGRYFVVPKIVNN
jgi:aspartyl-tRNA(Asn)/glutamyl-tRNA(Gln) amidotransferase subunit C